MNQDRINKTRSIFKENKLVLTAMSVMLVIIVIESFTLYNTLYDSDSSKNQMVYRNETDYIDYNSGYEDGATCLNNLDSVFGVGGTFCNEPYFSRYKYVVLEINTTEGFAIVKFDTKRS